MNCQPRVIGRDPLSIAALDLGAHCDRASRKEERQSQLPGYTGLHREIAVFIACFDVGHHEVGRSPCLAFKR